MKKRRALLLPLLVFLLIVGIPTGYVMREYRRERLHRDLIVAIKADDTNRALAALKSGADGNAREEVTSIRGIESDERERMG